MREHFESHILNVFDVCAYASDGKRALRRCSGQACGTMSREESTDRSVCATASFDDERIARPIGGTGMTVHDGLGT